MIISHKYKFIFVKTYKTAGTSIEVFLSQICGENDIVTPIHPHVEPHFARNYKGFANPIGELLTTKNLNFKRSITHFLYQQKFYNHMPASLIKQRIPNEIWNSYYKFCLERNPWDKTLSHYYMMRDRINNNLTLDDYFEQCELCNNFQHYTSDDGKLLVDEVVKYENFNEGLTSVFKRLNVPFSGDLGVRAKSGHRKDKSPYHKIFNEKQKRIVEKEFAEEIELLGYTY